MAIRSNKRISVLPLVLLILLIVSVGFGGYYFKQYQDLKSSFSKTPEQVNQELVDKVNKVFELPKDEVPVIFTVKSSDSKDFVTDIEKQIANTFKGLQKGDLILMYQKAGKAILYRESENKVIDTATLVVKSGSAVHIIGSEDAQNSTEALLAQKLPNDVRVSGKSTPVAVYTATTVVDLTGQKADVAKKIAEAIGGTVVSALPTGEKASDGAEIAIVIGTVQPVITETPAP